MLKRFAPAALSLAVFLTFAPGAHAAQRLVTQKSTTTGGVYLTAQLLAGHHYRVDVGAPKHTLFSGMGGENYTYVSQQHLLTDTKPFQLKGTTPKSFIIRQGIKGRVTGWILYMDVSLARGKNITVRILDLGTK